MNTPAFSHPTREPAACAQQQRKPPQSLNWQSCLCPELSAAARGFFGTHSDPNCCREHPPAPAGTASKRGPSLEQGLNKKSHSPPLLLPCMQRFKEKINQARMVPEPQIPRPDLLEYKCLCLPVLLFLSSLMWFAAQGYPIQSDLWSLLFL